MKNYILLIVLLLLSVSLFAQQRTITGKVSDANDGGPLPGVTVTLKNSNVGTATDADGNYEIGVPPGEAVLVFSFMGYTSQEVESGARTTIDVVLEPDVELLSDVVVVGYGEQKAINLTGSVETITGDDIARQPVVRASSALVGQVPGLTAVQGSGQPGADDAELTIRGIGTVGANPNSTRNKTNPLVLIDGIEGAIDGVNPRDIESITILKDASAAAIYGSRAANGVILVTTKRGTAGGFTVNYSAYGGWQALTDKPDYLGSYDYMRYYNIARDNMGQDPLYSEEEIEGYRLNTRTDPDHYPDTDWFDEVFSENGFQQSHHLSLSGGSETVKVLGSVGYTEQKGNVTAYGSKRYETRLNTDIKVSEKVGFGLDFSARRSINDQSAATLRNIIKAAYRLPPVYVARYSDGSWGPGFNGGNPVAVVNAGGFNQAQNTAIRGVLRGYYKPVEGLTLSAMFAPEYSDIYRKNFRRQHQVFNIDTKELEYTIPAKNNLQEQNNRVLTNNLNALAEYERAFGDHNFKGLLGYELITNSSNWFNAFRDDFMLQDYPQLELGSRENMQNDGTASEWGLESYFARVNYDYKGKYLVEANVRMDGSSRFAEGNKFGTFPSFSVGWRMSEEPFFNNVNFIDDLKLRASWGRMGNQNIGNYPFASTVGLTHGYIFGGVPVSGAAQTQLANRQISWETTETSNLGLDLSMLSGRLNMSAEYYVRNTYDILLTLPISATVQLDPSFQNAGKVRNTGWDLSVGWRDNIGEFSYSADFNISDVQNKVIDLVGTGPYINAGNSIIREGFPINSIYGYQSNGYFQDQDEIANAPGQFGALAPGDIRYINQLTIDTDGDGVPDAADDMVNAEDKVIIGDPFPRYSYGLQLSAAFKGFDLSAFVQGVGKRDVLLREDVVWAFYNAGKIQSWHTDFWTPENPDASYPRLVATTSHNNFEDSDFWVWNASYLRLRNVTFGYTLPGGVVDNTFIDRLRLYFSGQNLFTIDKMPDGLDPDIPNRAIGDNYPITSTYIFGLDLTF